VVLVGIVGVVVDAEDERDVLALGGGRDDDFLRAATVDVRARLGRVREDAGRLDHDLDAEILPRDLARVALREHDDRLAVDLDPAAGRFHVARERAVV
jgi:hypothetical protein